MTTQLENIASRFEPKIHAALLRAFEAIKSEITLTQIETALRTGGITAVNNILNDLQIEGIIEKEILDDLNASIMASGRLIIPVGTVYVYNVFNPVTAEYIRNYELNLIRLIGSNTREAIRNSIEADIIAGNNPISTARTFRDTIGLTPKQELAVRNYKKALMDLDSKSLNRRLRDKRFDLTVANAIRDKQKLSRSQIDNMVNRYRQRYVSYRAQTIARTESMRAVAVGEYTSGVQAVYDGAIERENIRRFWVYTKDKRTRNAHRLIPGLNPEGVEVDQPFKTPLGPLLYPRDPNGSAENTIDCRCIVIYKIK